MGKQQPATKQEYGQTWVWPELAEQRRKLALKFCVMKPSAIAGAPDVPHAPKGGLEELYERGIIDLMPTGDRLLLRVLLAGDISAGDLWKPDQDSRVPMLSEVRAVGPGCSKWWDSHDVPETERPGKGDFVWCLTTVADRLAALDPTLRLTTVRVEYCTARVMLR